MKTKHPLTTKFASLLSLGLILAAGAASAQITQTYNNLGTGTGDLNAIGFDSYGLSSVTGYDYTGTVVGAQGASPFGTNWAAINYVFSDPGAPAGYELTGIDLSIFVIDIIPNSTTSTFDIFAGLDRSGGVIGTFTLTEPTDENSFKNISIPLSALSGGFSIGYATNGSQPLFTSYTESHADPAFHPGVTFTYTEVIPEPSVALIGTLGLLPLLRRRRG